ncbi:hypothetical protein SPRG_09767 [Saprolegnia parasitica CBS 223.65]|uniref:DNA primase large subunit C-terminal domain-containing protein n=1 Tax=Saprolegnia parasitica (strain CBS 223.65) TaxID=695850 RepID=A0A067C3D0_SAPPC|nr:hypothetical protein SPRG_09767 [Saprolegnia parasitica CBS 223.65]KDO25038.1 hypothetical protein SPRG_09767 [Saprolegnia parasitica CBS 223.65]|eukprot:XP_012204306.1 hypothetical protein SPRG_09767 [Saprolegnia parasitica CBS 223.65]
MDLVYPTPPQARVGLDALADATLARLRVLVAVDASDDAQPVAADVVGYYGLRLMVAASSDAAFFHAWWLRAETKLFRARLRRYLDSNAAPSAKATLVQYLLARSPTTYATDNDGALRVPFYEVPSLVAQRDCTLRGGYCRISPLSPDMAVLLAQHRANALEIELTTAIRTLSFLDLDRFASLIGRVQSAIRDACQSQTLGVRGGRRRLACAADVDAAPLPLCMASLYATLTHTRHLKYDGRNQLRLFLKGAGFTYADNYVFWKTLFCPPTTPAEFEKKYAYNIKHGYGLVGSRKDYAPFDCTTIQNGPAPRAGQCHGCPFKHWETAFLVAKLRPTVGLETATAIAEMAKGGQYGRACAMHFEATTKRPVATISHPNVYLDMAHAALS